jgi:DNA primase
MSSAWVDFQSIKQSVTLEMVLAHYRISLRKVNQSSLRGTCPLPSHSSSKSGESFGANLIKNIWACQSHSCIEARQGRKGGGVIEFVAAMENVSIREAALQLQNWFGVTSTPAHPRAPNRREEEKSKLVAEEKRGSEVPESNRVLDFSLRGIDSSHEYLATHGITKETAEHFEVGYFPGKGSMAGRVVIPIHDKQGRLVAYAGRSLEESEPKYKLPGGFYKTLELFNLHRVLATGSDTAIITEGFFGCLHVHQCGYPAVVALMGSSMSDVQEALIVSSFLKSVLLLDGDEAGREATASILPRLAPKMFVKAITLPDRTQPDHLSPEEVCSLLGSL